MKGKGKGGALAAMVKAEENVGSVGGIGGDKAVVASLQERAAKYVKDSYNIQCSEIRTLRIEKLRTET